MKTLRLRRRRRIKTCPCLLRATYFWHPFKIKGTHLQTYTYKELEISAAPRPHILLVF